MNIVQIYKSIYGVERYQPLSTLKAKLNKCLNSQSSKVITPTSSVAQSVLSK